MKFTLDTVKNAKKRNSLKEWAIDFLNNEGENKRLAEILKEKNELYIDLLEFPLNKLRREMGPQEEKLKFSEDKGLWNKRIESLIDNIKKGHTLCPLIATDFWDDVHLSDGSHRYEALLQSGFDKYWVIFFIIDKKNIEWVLKNVS